MPSLKVFALAACLSSTTALAGFADSSGAKGVVNVYNSTPGFTVTALYTKSDGIVDWRACIDRLSPNVEHIEVKASHLGIGINPVALKIVAETLARPIKTRQAA